MICRRSAAGDGVGKGECRVVLYKGAGIVKEVIQWIAEGL